MYAVVEKLNCCWFCDKPVHKSGNSWTHTSKGCGKQVTDEHVWVRKNVVDEFQEIQIAREFAEKRSLDMVERRHKTTTLKCSVSECRETTKGLETLAWVCEKHVKAGYVPIYPHWCKIQKVVDQNADIDPDRRTVVCSICGDLGHNVRSCMKKGRQITLIDTGEEQRKPTDLECSAIRKYAQETYGDVRIKWKEVLIMLDDEHKSVGKGKYKVRVAIKKKSQTSCEFKFFEYQEVISRLPGKK